MYVRDCFQMCIPEDIQIRSTCCVYFNRIRTPVCPCPDYSFDPTHKHWYPNYEQYLDHVVSKLLRSAITQLRISAHNLRIEVGRWWSRKYGANRVQRCDRVCQLCETGDIEDEYHCVCRCPALVNERSFIPKHVYSKPSMFKFIDFLRNLTDIKAKHLAKFIVGANKQRCISIVQML
jgi:hypothetical protein